LASWHDVFMGRSFGWVVLPLLMGCSDLLGYDDVTFVDGGVSSGGGVPHGNGGASTGGASSGGSGNGGSAAGGASTGGAANGGSATGGSPSGGGGASAGGSSSGGTTGTDLESYRQKCVDKINEYRATLGLAPYQRWTSAESCADGEAKTDSETGRAHSAFPACGEWAQNECPGYGSLDSTVTTCLAQMWAEGPGADFQQHGHYINMSSTQYTQVACGFYVTSNGSVWAVQDFQ
jgi:hypothetical protein